MTIGRSELVDRLASNAGLTVAAATGIVAAWEKVLVEAVASGEGVKLPGLLAIEVVDRASRQGRNPRTGEAMTIPARKAVKVTPGNQLKAAAAA